MTTIEERLAKLEREIEELKRLIGSEKNKNWLSQLSGSCAGDEVMEEIFRLGKEWRDAERAAELNDFDARK